METEETRRGRGSAPTAEPTEQRRVSPWRLRAAMFAALFLLAAAFLSLAARIGVPGTQAIAEAPTVVFDVAVLALTGGAAWLFGRWRRRGLSEGDDDS